MTTDSKLVEDTLKQIDETWSKVKPGTRVIGVNNEGNPAVFDCSDPFEPIGVFTSEAEAEAAAKAPYAVETLTILVKKLLRERDEAREALQEISRVAEPAYNAFNEQKPVDMATVLRMTHHWSHYILAP